jgi:hypothetical protein
MTNATIAKNTTKKLNPIKYLRLPVDLKTQMYINQIKRQNPYFSDVDVVFYMMGKYIVNNNSPLNESINIFDRLREIHKDTPEMTEDEIFQILKDNDLM